VILAEGYQMGPGESLISPYRVRATPGYMETLNVSLLRGRLFSDGDTAASLRVVIVDDRLARKFWPGQDPVGRRMFKPENPEELTKPGPNQQWFTVVGVVAETKMAGLVTDEDRTGTYYFPMAQNGTRSLSLAVRTSTDPVAIVPQVRRMLTGIDPELPLYSVRTMNERERTDRRDADRPAHTDGPRGNVRRGRALPCGNWLVRSARLPGHAAPKGNRDPHGAWE